MKVNIKKIHKNAVLPKQASEFAGGWDVVCTEIIKEREDFVIYKLGFALQPPINYKVTLVPRSSLTKTYWILQNSPGLGDPDYTGEYQLRFRCIPTYIDRFYLDNIESYVSELAYEKIPYNVGDKVGQLYLEEIIPIEFEEVDELPLTQRGEGGFGSTGT